MFVFDKPAVKSRMQHKHELAIKRINNDNVDTFHKLWMPIASEWKWAKTDFWFRVRHSAEKKGGTIDLLVSQDLMGPGEV